MLRMKLLNSFLYWLLIIAYRRSGFSYNEYCIYDYKVNQSSMSRKTYASNERSDSTLLCPLHKHRLKVNMTR